MGSRFSVKKDSKKRKGSYYLNWQEIAAKGFEKNTDSLGAGDCLSSLAFPTDDVESQSKSSSQLSSQPAPEYCPHCRLIVRTSEEIEAEHNLVIQNMKEYLQFLHEQEQRNLNLEKCTAKSKEKFATILRIRRPKSALEERMNISELNFVFNKPYIEQMTEIIDTGDSADTSDEDTVSEYENVFDKAASFGEQVTNQRVVLKRLNIAGAECIETFFDNESPRCLEIPDDMWI